MNSKEGLIAAYKGGPKGKAHPGTLVRLTRDVEMGSQRVHREAGVYEVAHLMTHQKGHYSDVVAVFVPERRGLCFSLPIKDLDLAEVEVRPGCVTNGNGRCVTHEVELTIAHVSAVKEGAA